MAALQDTSIKFYQNGKVTSAQSLGDFYDTLVGTVGSDTSAASYQYTYQGTLASTFKEEKLSVSAVSLDEELTNLIMKHYRGNHPPLQGGSGGIIDRKSVV